MIIAGRKKTAGDDIWTVERRTRGFNDSIYVYDNTSSLTISRLPCSHPSFISSLSFFFYFYTITAMHVRLWLRKSCMFCGSPSLEKVTNEISRIFVFAVEKIENLEITTSPNLRKRIILSEGFIPVTTAVLPSLPIYPNALTLSCEYEAIY